MGLSFDLKWFRFHLYIVVSKIYGYYWLPRCSLMWPAKERRLRRLGKLVDM